MAVNVAWFAQMAEWVDGITAKHGIWVSAFDPLAAQTWPGFGWGYERVDLDRLNDAWEPKRITLAVRDFANWMNLAQFPAFLLDSNVQAFNWPKLWEKFWGGWTRNFVTEDAAAMGGNACMSSLIYQTNESPQISRQSDDHIALTDRLVHQTGYDFAGYESLVSGDYLDMRTTRGGTDRAEIIEGADSVIVMIEPSDPPDPGQTIEVVSPEPVNFPLMMRTDLAVTEAGERFIAVCWAKSVPPVDYDQLLCIYSINTTGTGPEYQEIYRLALGTYDHPRLYAFDAVPQGGLALLYWGSYEDDTGVLFRQFSIDGTVRDTEVVCIVDATNEWENWPYISPTTPMLRFAPNGGAYVAWNWWDFTVGTLYTHRLAVWLRSSTGWVRYDSAPDKMCGLTGAEYQLHVYPASMAVTGAHAFPGIYY